VFEKFLGIKKIKKTSKAIAYQYRKTKTAIWKLLKKLHQICDRFPLLLTIWVDRGYEGKAFILAILHTFYWCLQVVVPPVGQKGFVEQKKSWVVERTFA